MYFYFRIAVFSCKVLKDERIVIIVFLFPSIVRQRPDCTEEEVGKLMVFGVK